jgi:regulator of protease activity HflC (stomatin/prohibitin superfamily)
MSISLGLAIIFGAFILLNLYLGICIVRQSEQLLVERLGRYQKTLEPGLNLINPFVERVSYRVKVWQQNIPEFILPVITADNVEVELVCTIYWRILNPGQAMYRAENVEYQMTILGKSAVRSAVGKVDLDELTKNRDMLINSVTKQIQEATQPWGIEVSSFEIIAVTLDEQTRDAQRLQVLAEREKRAQEKHAEAEQIKVERAADAYKYEKDREAEAIKAISDAKSYELDTIAKVLNKNGAEIGNYDIMSKQIVALGELAASDSSKSIIMPTNVTASLGSVQALMDIIGGKDKNK